MATTAPARRAPARPRYADERETRPAARRAPQARPRAAVRSGMGRALVVFVICLTALAAGRVALSFAVVQKTLQTDAIVRQQREVTADNARLEEELAKASSNVHIRDVAQRDLGLVDPEHVSYLSAPRASGAKAGTRR